MNRLSGKTAIVTGAAAGIGRATAEIFAEESAWVLVTDIDGDGAELVAAEIRRKGGQAEAKRVDIGRRDEIESAVALVGNKFGRVDVLCNNAAYIASEWHDSLNATDEEWAGCLNVTVLGTQHFTRAVVPWMIKHKRGSIIITSSILGMVACPNAITYSTAKAGLIGFSRCAARDYGKENIRVNVISPGPIKVGYSPLPGTSAHTHQVNNTFLARTGLPREVGYAALFLASEESAFITGAVLPVDGGWTAM